MNSLFSFIPESVDKNLRNILIFLISLQFTAFVLYMYFIIKDYLKIRKERSQQDQIPQPDEKESSQGEQEKNKDGNAKLEKID